MFDVVLSQLAVVAVVVQRVIDFVKPAYQGYEWQAAADKVLSVFVSALMCVLWQIDVFAVVGISVANVWWLGMAATGVIAGLGSNILNDLLAMLEALKNKPKLWG